ncbi:hypothetical protein [Clostridium sp. HCS.1]|uniref:hypothetical protein n=1 Tax=Clostridium sp. HCS.1 TaxID=3238594 RepID=UPI003A0FEAF1
MINISKIAIKLTVALFIITLLIFIFSLCIGEVMVTPLHVIKSKVVIDTGF